MATPPNTSTTNSSYAPLEPFPAPKTDELVWRGRFALEDYNPPEAASGVAPATLGTVIDGSAQQGFTAVRTANAAETADTESLTSGFSGMIQEAVDAFWGGIKTAASAVGNGLNFLTNGWLYGKYGGTTILIGGAVGLGLLAYWLSTRGGSSPAAATPVTASAAQSQMMTALDRAAGQATDAGLDPTAVQTQRSMTELIYGTPLTGTIRNDSSANPTPLNPNRSDRSFETSLTNPTHYQSLAKLNTARYLHSLSQKQTRDTIMENSAAVHGADVQPQ